MTQKPKWFGLMFEFRKGKTCRIELEKEDKLHTYFCRTLDIWFYNEDDELIATNYAVKPFSIVRIPESTKYIIEMTI